MERGGMKISPLDKIWALGMITGDCQSTLSLAWVVDSQGIP